MSGKFRINYVKTLESFTCLMYADNKTQLPNFFFETNDKKNVGDSKIDLARLPPCFSELIPHIYRVNHLLAFYKRPDKSFVEAPNPYHDKQGWLKKQNSLLEPI